jgi:hypothetical protein
MIAMVKKQSSKVDNVGNMIKNSIRKNTKTNKSYLPNAMSPYNQDEDQDESLNSSYDYKSEDSSVGEVF